MMVDTGEEKKAQKKEEQLHIHVKHILAKNRKAMKGNFLSRARAKSQKNKTFKTKVS